MVNNQLDKVEEATTKEDEKQEIMNKNYTIKVLFLCCPYHSCLSWQMCVCMAIAFGLSHSCRQVTYACAQFCHVHMLWYNTPSQMRDG